MLVHSFEHSSFISYGNTFLCFIAKVFLFFLVEVRTLCRPVKVIHTKLYHPCFHGPCSVPWYTVLLEQVHPQTVCPQGFLSLDLRGQAQLLKIVLTALAWNPLQSELKMSNCMSFYTFHSLLKTMRVLWTMSVLLIVTVTWLLLTPVYYAWLLALF